MENTDKIERHMEQKIKYYITKVVKVIFFIILGVAIAFLIGYVVMRLWNWLLPELFGIPEVSYWQAVGVLILAKIIFGFGSGNGPGKKRKSKKRIMKRKCLPFRSDFSDWKHYDQFWREEGEDAYRNYVEKMKNKNNTDVQEQENI